MTIFQQSYYVLGKYIIIIIIINGNENYKRDINNGEMRVYIEELFVHWIQFGVLIIFPV